MKKIVSILMIAFGLVMVTKPVHANEVKEFSYPLNETKAMIFESINEDGEIVITEIEKLPSFSRIASGTYKISKTVKGSWSVVYYISINTKNQITSANKLNITAYRGSINTSKLSYTSSKATCTFSQKAGTVTTKASVIASISNKKLVIK